LGIAPKKRKGASMKPTPQWTPLPAGTPDPIPFKRALRIAIGGRHIDERVRIFRACWQAWRENPPPLGASGESLGRWFDHKLTPSEAIARFKATGVRIGTVFDWFHLIHRWRGQHQCEVNRRNIKSRWSAKKAC
jgi:hypothetical protein